MTTVKVAQGSVAVSSENRDHRILTTFAIFTTKIRLESAFAGAQQAQSVPATIAGERSQRGRFGGSDDRKVNVLSQMMSNAIVAVDPGGTHRTGLGLILS